MPMAMNPYFPILVAFLINGTLALLVSTLAFVLGPKKPTEAKLDVYECGVPVPPSSSRARVSVKYYLTAILFILFDLETIFLYLWAVSFHDLRWLGVLEVGLFISTLLIGYVYIIKRKALHWE